MCEGKQRSRSIERERERAEMEMQLEIDEREREREIAREEMEMPLQINGDEAMEEDETSDEVAGYDEFIEGLNARHYEEFINGLDSRIQAIVETSKILLAHPAEELEQKKDWDAVLEMGEELRSFSLVWIESKLQDVKSVMEDLDHFLILLEGLLMRARGATVGSQLSLFLCIEDSMKTVVSIGLELVRVATKHHDSEEERRVNTVLKVSEFRHCLDDLKKTPRSNASAIESELLHVAASISQEFTEIKEISQALAGFEEMNNPQNFLSTLSAIFANLMKMIPSLILFLRDHDEAWVTDFQNIVTCIEDLESAINNVRNMVDPPPNFPGIQAAILCAAQAVNAIHEIQGKF